MGEKKVTKMVIKVDLGCEKCQSKIKKILCKIPQIQNQVYDEKANTVTVTVICCSPEKIKKKIYCKGGESIQCIKIVEPEKLEEPEVKPNGKPEVKPNGKPKPERVCCKECSEGNSGGPCHWGFYGRPHPCYVVYGTPAPPPCYEVYCRPVYDSWGCGGSYYYSGCRRGCYVGRCYCENPSACTMM